METIKNINDLGYQFSAFQDATGAFIAYAKEHIPGFPNKDKIDDEIVAAFKSGCLRRFTELHPPIHYIVTGEDTFEQTDDSALAGFNLSVDYAVGMSKFDFGQLAANKKHLVKELRDSAKNYADLRWSRLLKTAAEEGNETKTRASNKLFMEWLNSVLADAPKKAKLAIKNGDRTATDPEALRTAIEAFKKMLNGKEAIKAEMKQAA